MSRPRTFDELEVVDAVTDVFWRDGYEATSVSDLSAATGLSPSSIYNAFGSKLELYLASLDRYLAVLEETRLAPLRCGARGLADLHAFLDGIERDALRVGAPPGCMGAKAIVEFGDRCGPVEARTRRYRDDLRAAIGEALRRGAERGELPAAEVALRSEAIVGLLIAFNVYVAAGTPPSQSRELMRAIHAVVEPSSE